MEERRIAGFLLIILAVSLEFNSRLLIRVYTQPEELARRLEEHLGKAVPESLLAEECEYVAPEGFNNTLAERLWRDFGFYVSAGHTTRELRDELREAYGDYSLVNATLQNGGTIGLNISGVTVERNLGDGSVAIRIPVASSMSLNYTRFNYTKTAGFYEAWNKTLVREYRVWRRVPGWYVYSFEDLELNKSFTVVSRIWGESSRVEEAWLEGLRKLGGGAWNQPVRYLPSFEYTLWGWMRVKGPVIAVPGHYEDVRVLYPEHERSFKVLFPAYDPVIIEGWIIRVNVSSTSLNVGETLEASYLAEYCSPFGGEPEPLNATLTLNAPASFEPLNSLETRLDEAHSEGVFRLKAVKPGTYNLTLRLYGNAVFANTAGSEEKYTVQIVSPPSPSLSIGIVDRDASVLKHAKLVLRLRNNGGSPARSIVLKASGSSMESVSKSLGSIEAGESRDVELYLRLLQPSSPASIIVKYSDDDGNPFLVSLETMVSTETFWVPEHFETYTVIVPEHEETLRVFVPGFEGATHIRLYALWDERIIGEAVFRAEKLHEATYYEERLSTGLIPVPVPGLGVELSIRAAREALTEAGVKMMVKSIEPYYEYTGVLKEDEALRLVNADKEALRSGNTSSDFRVEPLKPYWVKTSSIVLNSTELALYQAMMEGLKKTNPDIDYDFRETMVDVRTRIGGAEPGYLTLIYRPLKIVGEGPLKTVRVRNFAAIGLDYRVDVEASGKASQRLQLDGNGDAVILSSSLHMFRQEVRVNLTFNGRLVAEASFTLDPESSAFWRGFWDGFKGRLPTIILTGMVMIILTVASKGTVGTLLLKLSVLTVLSAMIVMNAASQYLELGQVLSTAVALKQVDNALRSHAKQFKSLGYSGTAGLLNDAAEEVARVVESVNANLSSIVDFLSRVCTDLSLEEWGALLGLREAEPYEKGVAWGKAVGSAISLAVFVAGFCSLATSSVTPASLGARAKVVLHGLWNWLTPALTDAASIVWNSPRLAKGFGILLTILSRARKLGFSLASLLKMDAKGVADLAGIYDKIIERILDAAKRKEISDEAVEAIRELCARAAELGEEEARRLAVGIDTLLSKNTGFADWFLVWTRRVNPAPKWTVETTGGLSSLSGEKLGSLLDPLSKIEADKEKGFENGFKLFNTYLGISDKYASQQVEAFRDVFLKDVKSYGVEALDAWCSAVEKNGFAARASKEETPYPFIHAEVYQALGKPKVGAWFTVVTRLDGREIRIAAELAAKQAGEYTIHRLAPAREGSFTMLEAERFVEVYPGWNDINLIIKTGIGEGGEIKYTVQNPDADYIRSIGEGFYEIAYWRLGEPSVEHHRVRGLYSSTSAICFPSDGEGTYVIRLVRRVDEAFLLSLYNGPGQLSYSGGKYFLNLYGVTLTGESKYSHGIAGGMGGVEIVFPLFGEGEHAESLAVVSTVNDQGEWSSRIGYGSGRKGWRYVYSMPPPSDENGYRVFKIFFGENEPEGAAFVKYDPGAGEFSSYRISRDSTVFKEALGSIIGDKYSFAKETDTVSGAARWVPTRSLKEYGDAVGVIRSLSGINPKYDEGVAGHMIAAEFVKENKGVFGIGQEIEVLEGKNLFIDEVGNNEDEPLDVRVMDPSNPKRIIAALEVKLTTSPEESLTKHLGGEKLKEELRNRIKNAREDYNYELPENIYVLAIKITMEKIEFAWRKYSVAEVLKSGGGG